VDTWQLLLGVGGFLTPIVLAAMARDRAHTQAITGAKEDMAREIKSGIDPLHERVNRVRDEYVRRDDLDGHLVRLDKRFDEMNAHILRSHSYVEKRLDEITAMLRRP